MLNKTASPSRSSTAARDVRNLSLSLLVITLTLSTIYSVYNQTYLDTSDPLLASLPHPSASKSYFARKENIFNQWFVKKAWAWTSGVFALLYITSPRSRQTNARLVGYVIATGVWGVFTSWFFGKSIFERLLLGSGGECVIVLPNTVGGGAHSVPLEYCYTRSKLTTSSHPQVFSNLFADSLQSPNIMEVLPVDFVARPRLYRGHDVSGHIFLLTLAILFLTDQLSASLFPRPKHASIWNKLAIGVTGALLALWWWMSIMTAVYYHRPLEKLSGFLIALVGYMFTLVPSLSSPPPRVGKPIPENKLRTDAMHID